MSDDKFARMEREHDAKLRAGPREEPEGCDGSAGEPGWVIVGVFRGFRRCPGCDDCQPCMCQGEDTCPRHTPPEPEGK